MARVIIEGLTRKQALTFAKWYEGQGEQDADIWFQEARCPTPMTDCGREGGYKQIVGDDVIIYCQKRNRS